MKKNPKTIIAGVLQFDVKSGDIDANLTSVTNGIARLGEKGSHIAVLPELWSAGFGSPSQLILQAEKTPQILETLSQFAKKHHMIIAGSLPEKDGNGLYNTMMIIDKDGTMAGTYRKIHLFSSIGEDKAFFPGNQAVVCNT